MREFTQEELAQYDGKDSAQAYIAYQGKVYDVSDSYFWRGGRHWAEHQAGADLTGKLASAPHGENLLDRVEAIGTLK